MPFILQSNVILIFEDLTLGDLQEYKILENLAFKLKWREEGIKP